MQAVILAGGRGTRLRPLTYTVPKPMAPVRGQPFLTHQLLLLKKCGITDILLCVGYKWKKIRAFFGNGKRLGLRIVYSVEKRLRGTGGALKQAEQVLQGEFLLINGDTFLPFDYRKLIRAFHAKGATGMLVVTKNKDRSRVGNLSLDRTGHVTEYQKTTKKKMLAYLDAGVAVYKKCVVRSFPAKRAFSFEKHVYARLIRQKELIAYVAGGRFYDIGTPERLEYFEKKVAI